MIASYKSAQHVADILNIDRAQINHCCNGNIPTVGGMIFKYN